LETATLLLLFCGIGLILALAWTLYRINTHKRRISGLESDARSIGAMHGEVTKEDSAPATAPPTLPDSELLLVMYRNRDRPWRGAVATKLEKGSKAVIVSTVPPGEIREFYGGRTRFIWLDRSTAHDLEKDAVVVNPTNLSGILDEISNFLKLGSVGGVIVFEGFEDLVNQNDISRVLKFLNMLRQLCRDRSLSAVVPFPYKAVTQRIRNQLTEGFESVVIG
jgi:hypothetical protein